MILFHPISNKAAIEKYKDRGVYIYNKKLELWLFKKDVFTFKEALKLTKHYKSESKIEYHFIDELGEEKLDIKEFDQENVINCTAVKFEKYSHNTTRNHFTKQD